MMVFPLVVFIIPISCLVTIVKAKGVDLLDKDFSILTSFDGDQKYAVTIHIASTLG
jgi:hypothetical protein